jgi:ribosome biogenesis GTPase / thiamine phosphate phosphatase
MREDKHYQFEEDFHSKDKKFHRKERKHATSRDRSKFKKSDQDQLKKAPATIVAEGNVLGRVLAITAEGILVAFQEDFYTCSLKGALKQEKGRQVNLIAVGDLVWFTPGDDKEGVISYIEERKSILSRPDPISQKREKLIAVNIDQVIITASVLLPPLKPPLIDRYIIAAMKGNMEPLIVINKVDLLVSPPDQCDAHFVEEERRLWAEFLEAYKHLPLFPVSTVTLEGIDALKRAMQGKTSVFSGQSGVGKSSLINTLIGSSLKVGEIVEKTRKGSHTTTTALLLPLDGGGFCVDTPGIKSFGLWEASSQDIQNAFPEILQVAPECKYPDCSHREEPGCAVKEAVESGKISRLRFASYSALIAGLNVEYRQR